jgi:arsenate reductase (thioredoxin)
VEERTYNVLFLCTGNSARSIMAEALLNRIGAGRFRAFSAGSQPRGEVNPLTLKTLQEFSESIQGLRSKSWEEFSAPEAPRLDFVFTVCANAAREECPVWPGQPMTAHWGIDDPASVEGTEAEKMRAFRDAYHALLTRIRLFSSLGIQLLDRLVLQRELRSIGETTHEPVRP